MKKALEARTKGAKIKKKKKKNLRVKAARASDKARAATYAGGFVLASNDAIGIDRGDCIFDSGDSRYLVNDGSLRLPRVGSVHLEFLARGMKMNVTRPKSILRRVWRRLSYRTVSWRAKGFFSGTTATNAP